LSFKVGQGPLTLPVVDDAATDKEHELVELGENVGGGLEGGTGGREGREGGRGERRSRREVGNGREHELVGLDEDIG